MEWEGFLSARSGDLAKSLLDFSTGRATFVSMLSWWGKETYARRGLSFGLTSGVCSTLLNGGRGWVKGIPLNWWWLR